MIHKISFNNVINEMKNIFKNKRKEIIAKYRSLRKSSNVYNDGLLDGIIGMIEDKACKVFLSVSWIDIRWYSSAALYTNCRYCETITGNVNRIKEIKKMYSCVFLNHKAKLSKDALRYLCKMNNLKVSGNKNVLIKRLLSI